MQFVIPSVTVRIESNQLLFSKKEVCGELLKKDFLTEREIIECLISLHIVLEVGINTFFRLTYNTITDLDYAKNENLADEISFIDKTKFLLATNRFTFESGEDRRQAEINAARLLKLILDFSPVRNWIMHGHSISESSTGDTVKQSKLKERMNKEYLDKQVTKFREIIRIYNYFIDRLQTSVSREQLQNFQGSFLSVDFLDT